jgi:hypothetical protein
MKEHHLSQAPKAVKGHSSATLVGAISGDRVGMSSAIASQPTREMRAELLAAGGVLPDDAALTKLSSNLNDWLEAQRQKENLEHSHSWFNLFAMVDADGSGCALEVSKRRAVEWSRPLTHTACGPNAWQLHHVRRAAGYHSPQAQEGPQGHL